MDEGQSPDPPGAKHPAAPAACRVCHRELGARALLHAALPCAEGPGGAIHWAAWTQLSGLPVTGELGSPQGNQARLGPGEAVGRGGPEHRRDMGERGGQRGAKQITSGEAQGAAGESRAPLAPTRALWVSLPPSRWVFPPPVPTPRVFTPLAPGVQPPLPSRWVFTPLPASRPSPQSLREALAEHRPLMGKLQRVCTQLAELSPEQGAPFQQRCQAAEERYGSIRECVRQAATVLEDAIPRYSQVHRAAP